jgi:hypothetical protein
LKQQATCFFYQQHTREGHFAAMEQPVALWTDVEDFLDLVKSHIDKHRA